ncbi:hypothetical protein EMIT0P253_270043 [Pseudomonas sp. IT-P253]
MLVKSNAIGGQTECKRVVKCSAISQLSQGRGARPPWMQRNKFSVAIKKIGREWTQLAEANGAGEGTAAVQCPALPT